MSVFSDTLRKTRKETGLTQEQLSEQLNICRDTLYNWENDIRKPDIDELQKLCEIFECDAGYLLGEYETRRAASASMIGATRLSIKALDNLMAAAESGNPYIQTVSALLEDESLLNHITRCCNIDYGHISTFVDIPDPFASTSSRVLIDPNTLRRSDAMTLYNELLEYINKTREHNNIPGLYEV